MRTRSSAWSTKLKSMPRKTANAEVVQLRNDSESIIFQAEKTLTEYGDRIPAEIKAEVDQKVAAVKDILENDRENVDRLQPAYDELVASLSKVGASMYEAAGEQSPDGADG